MFKVAYYLLSVLLGYYSRTLKPLVFAPKLYYFNFYMLNEYKISI